MDLSTTYLGLKLKNPLIAGSSPLSKDIAQAKKLEEAGAAAIVMYSLFEEQINHEKQELDHFLCAGTESFAEALSYFPEPEAFNNIDAEEYLEHLKQLKKTLSIPVIASLNGVSEGGWTRYARHMQDAGADAIELNIYYVANQLNLTADKVEQMYVDALRAVKSTVSIPVSIKVGPYFTAFANFAQKLDKAGADGLVLFNRFFGPDIDLDKLEVNPQLTLSSAWEMRLPLRWIAVLNGNIEASLAGSSGVRTASDVIKMVMAGAHVTQMTSVLLERGPAHLKDVLANMQEWMKQHDYQSIEGMRGSMSYRSVAEPAAYERANYMKALHSYQ